MILKPVAKVIRQNMTRLNYLTFTDGLIVERRLLESQNETRDAVCHCTFRFIQVIRLLTTGVRKQLPFSSHS